MSKITVRRSTAVPKKRAEIETLLTHEGVERFLKELGRGALEAKVTNAEPASDSDAAAETPLTDDAAKLGLGDTVTVQLTALEFTGLTGLAQMLIAAKAPAPVKSFIEKTPVFEKVGAGLDLAYGVMRGGLTFTSKVTEWNSDSDSLTYVDEGVQLPKPLKSWRHTHTISEAGEGGIIVDELTVEVVPALAAPVVESALRLHLESRAKAYKKALDAN